MYDSYYFFLVVYEGCDFFCCFYFQVLLLYLIFLVDFVFFLYLSFFLCLGSFVCLVDFDYFLDLQSNKYKILYVSLFVYGLLLNFN